MKYETMIECLRSVCPDYIDIIGVKDLRTRWKVTFKYGDVEEAAELPKTCAPNCHVKVCKQCIASAMSAIMFRKECYDSASKWLEWPYEKEPSKNMSVCKLIPLGNKEYTYRTLYEFIDNPDDAYILAQLAMSERENTDELIFIFPGMNIDIQNRAHLIDYANDLKAEILEKMQD